MDGIALYREITTLSSGTQATLYREATGETGHVVGSKLDPFVLNFAEWAEEQDGGPFANWMEAWQAYKRAGYPGLTFVTTGQPQ